MDHTTMFGPENEQSAIAIALSDVVYHLNAGYVGYATVHDKLVEIWNRGARNDHDPILIQNGSNRDLLNEAIGAGAALGPQQPAFVGNRTLITMIYTDIGSVDLDELAFRIFGLNIESRYYAFFLLLSLSAAAYLIVFGVRPLPTVVLLCTLFAFYIEIHTAIFSYNMPTFPSERHGSTLALIPLWHFTFLLLDRRRASAATVLATLIQLAILLLAMRIRGAAIWVLIFIAALSFTLAIIDWRRLSSEERTWRRLLRVAARWPLVLLVGGFLVNGQYLKSTLHPVYFTDDVLPYHGLWASAFAGVVVFAPELLPAGGKTSELAQNMGEDLAAREYLLDRVIAAAALEYLNDTHFLPLPPDYPSSTPPSFVSPWTGTYKFRLMDDIMRHVFLRIAVHHPTALLKLYFYEKPCGIAFQFYRVIADSPDLKWLWLLMLGAISSFGISFAFVAIRPTPSDFRVEGTLLAVLAALAFTTLPSLWAWPTSYSVVDLLLVTCVFFELLFSAAAILLIGKLPWRLRLFASTAKEGMLRRVTR